LLFLPRSFAGRAGFVGSRRGRVPMGCWTRSGTAGGLVRAAAAAAAVILLAHGACAAKRKDGYNDNAAPGGGGSDTDSMTQAAGGAANSADASGPDGGGPGALPGPGLAMAPPTAVQQLASPAEDPESAPMPEDGGLQMAGVPVDSGPPPDAASESAQPPESNAYGGAAVADAPPPQEVPAEGMQAPPDMPDETAGPPPPSMPMEAADPNAAQDQADGVQELPAIPEGDGSEESIAAMQRAAAIAHAQRSEKRKHDMISQFMKNFARNMRYSVLEDSEGDMPEEQRQNMMQEINDARGGPPPESMQHEENALPIEQVAEQMRPRFRSSGMQREEPSRRHRHRSHMLNQAPAWKQKRHHFQMLNTHGAAPDPQDAASPAVADGASAATPPAIEPLPTEGSPPPESGTDILAVASTTIPLLQVGQSAPMDPAAAPRSVAQRPHSVTGAVNILALIMMCLVVGET